MAKAPEKIALTLMRRINEDPRLKAAQRAFHYGFGMRWVDFCTRNLVHVHGMDRAAALHPERGVLLCANHRSFFDQYIISLVLMKHRVPWMQNIYFPVRANFFYETWAGIAVNLLVGGGAMYPPIFRDRERAAENKLALERVSELLQEPGNVVGIHPEGTRGKGPDPYQLLPAQPGVGMVALWAKPTVIPVWINGLSNDFVEQVASNFRKGDRRGDPVHILFGDPVDLEDLWEKKPRAALYKRAADRILDDIRKLGEKERQIRQAGA